MIISYLFVYLGVNLEEFACVCKCMLSSPCVHEKKRGRGAWGGVTYTLLASRI